MREYLCPICTKKCTTDVIECSYGKHWVHRKCCNMTSKDLESWSVDKLSFVCKKCTFNGSEYDCNGALQRYVLFI